MVPEPTSAIDWNNLGFDLYKTNGYVEYTFKDGAWDSGKWQTDPFMKLHVSSVALNYGQSLFEGLKAFRGKDGQIRIFRPSENAKRMQHGAETVCMPDIPEEMFVEACKRVVAGNLEFVPPYAPGAAKGAMYLRPLYFGSGAEILLGPAKVYTFLVFVTPVGALYPAGRDEASIPAMDALIVSGFDRAAPRGTGTAKLAGNYAPVFRWTKAAKAKGYGVTLHLDSATHSYIDEFSTSNCLFIKTSGDEVTLVVPESDSILRSITTKSVVDVAKDVMGWKVEKRPVKLDEVKEGVFSECAATGTAAIISPVKSISYEEGDQTHRVAIGGGVKAGPHFIKLLITLTGIQSGDNKDVHSWLVPSEGLQPL